MGQVVFVLYNFGGVLQDGNVDIVGLEGLVRDI